MPTYHLDPLLLLVPLPVDGSPDAVAAVVVLDHAHQPVPEGSRAAGVHQEVQRRVDRQQQVAHTGRHKNEILNENFFKIIKFF